jgi:hypothetical protein
MQVLTILLKKKLYFYCFVHLHVHFCYFIEKQILEQNGEVKYLGRKSQANL